MALFIVSYRRDAEGVCCTNIAVAEDREQVEAEYGECDFIAINPAKCYEVEELRQRGCPVVECKRAEEASATYEQMVDKLSRHFQHDRTYNDDTDISWGYCLAIADMFGKDKSEVAKDMRKVLKARKGDE